MIGILICLIAISGMAFADADSLTHPGYVRETILETKANELPLNLRLSLGYPDIFGSKRKNILDGPNVPSISVTNEARLITQAWDSLKVFQFSGTSWMIFSPKFDSFGYVYSCFCGPGDDLYVLFKVSGDIYYGVWKLAKYRLKNDDYVIDSNFVIIQKSQPPGQVFISPDNHIYAARWGSSSDNRQEMGVFDSLGGYIGETKAWCNLNNGTRFYPKTFQEKDFNWYAELTNPDNDSVLFPGKIKERQIDGGMQCTFDNSIIFLGSDRGKIALNDSLSLMIDRSYALILYPVTSDSFRIEPYFECARDDYKFHTAGHLDANFKGDIYCFVVYFNTPGKINGDEKIVLYRWRKIQEK
jgi:hypothetical protein